jgi:hypothetical protein
MFNEPFIDQWVATRNFKLDIGKLYFLLAQCIYVFCMSLRTVIISLYSITIYFYNRDGVYLLRGTD